MKGCGIITSGEVGAAFGGTVTSVRVATTGTGSPLCEFTMAGTNTGSAGTVSVSTHGAADGSSFRKTKASNNLATSVSGVGDNAYYVQPLATLQFIWGKSEGSVQARMHTVAQRTANQLESDVIAVAKRVVAD